MLLNHMDGKKVYVISRMKGRKEEHDALKKTNHPQTNIKAQKLAGGTVFLW